MKLLIADDHAVVRNGIIQILTQAFAAAEFGQSKDRDTTMAQVLNEKWDIVIMDLSMPGANGFDLITDVKAACPETPIIVLSMHPADQFGLRAIKIGAQGYLNKETAPEELVTAVEAALSGQVYLAEGLFEKGAISMEKALQGIPTIESLSNREFAVMRLIFEGHQMKEVAARLDLSPKTVSTYRQRILEKLSLHSNAELIQYIVKNQIF